MPTIDIPVVRVRQNNWNMYVGVIGAEQLYRMAEVDRIRLESLVIPKYAGYQRALIEERVQAIRDYLNTPDCTFPNSIILTLDSECIENWEEIAGAINVSVMKINEDRASVKIIDGQHRSAAMNAASSGFQAIVTIFVDLEMARCAQLFAKINSTQKAVNPSIAFQLFGYAEGRSPQKTAHEVAGILNTTEGSPFYKKLNMLGTRDDWADGTLSQSTFCKYLMTLYSRKPSEDENRLLRGEPLERYEGCPLRAYFVDQADDKILQVVWKFFYHVASTWHDQWYDASRRSILVKTTGYISLIEVMRLWLLGPRRDEVLNDERVRVSLESIRGQYISNEKRFIKDNYPAGHQGVVTLRDSLLHDLGL